MPTDIRRFEPAKCWLCGDPAVWLVYEDKWDDTSETLMTCDEDKWSAFS